MRFMVTGPASPLEPRRIPLNLFGTAFGMVGLAGAWLTMSDFGHAPVAVGDTLLAISALVWLLVTAAYLRYAVTARAFGRDLLDPIAAPFASLALIVPMLLAVEGLYPHSHAAGRLVLNIFLVLTVALGGWFTGQWLYAPMNLETFHPGYFLPTVAGGLIAAEGAARVGEHRLGEVMFGLGTICWVILGSVIVGRLFFGPLLPPPLIPTYAIEVAPPAVAILAYLAIRGDRIDIVVAFLSGYGLLMILAQLRLVPVYLKLPFMPSTWAHTFSWAAVATAALHWLQALHPTDYRFAEYTILAAITVLIGGIAIRTLLALSRREFLAAAPPRAIAVGTPSSASL